MKNKRVKYFIIYLIAGFIVPILIGLISVNLGAFLLLLYLISLPILVSYFIRKYIKSRKLQQLHTKDKDINEQENKKQDNLIYKRNLTNRKNKYNYVNRKLNDYIVIDTETTGLSAQKDQIIEISALKVKDGLMMDNYTSLVNPGIEIPKSSMKIHGITNEMVQNAPTIDEVIPKFLTFIEDKPLVGHNISFDLRFINSYLEKNLNKQLADTMLISRRKLPTLPNHKLITLINHYNLGENQDHRSLSDCIYTHKVYENLK